MFQIINTTNSETINKSIGYIEADFVTHYNNGTYDITPLSLEKCEIGKNIDIEYKNLDNVIRFGKTLSDFECFSPENGNKSLFYDPSVGFSSISLYINLRGNNSYTPENLQALIINENNLIDHSNKDSPISKSYIYQITDGFSSYLYTTINFNFQYIRYESDDGLLFKNSKIFSGISFEDMIFYKTFKDNYDLHKNSENLNTSRIGTITLQINKSNYDNYLRTYPRLQSLLADVMSVINLLLEIGRILSNFLCTKKMSNDIIRNLLNKKEIKNKSLHLDKIKLFKNNEMKQIDSSQIKINNNQNMLNKTNNIEYLDKNDFVKINKSNDNLEITNEITQENINDKVLKHINYFHIIKSFLCFNDKRTNLINLCHNIIIEDMSIERILERFYNLENIYSSFPNEIQDNFGNNNKLKEVNKYIEEINSEIKVNSVIK